MLKNVMDNLWRLYYTLQGYDYRGYIQYTGDPSLKAGDQVVITGTALFNGLYKIGGVVGV